MKRNYYARTVGCNPLVHAFGSRAERDSWVDDNWRDRVEIGWREARVTASACGLIYLHDAADVPESWVTQSRGWWIDRVAPDLARASAI